MATKKLIDNWGRPINYLRLAVTDRCNLRCFYCMPEEGIHFQAKKRLLKTEEICRIIELMSGMGVSKIRFTGGEPLLRKDLPELIQFANGTDGIESIHLTTNGLLLDKYIKKLENTIMNDNSKISVGLLIPAVSIIAFVSMLFSENYIAALFVAISGLMVWFAYSAVMNAKMPDITGNIVMVFGVLLSTAFFLNYGLLTNMFGGFEIKLEGVVGSVLILFFTVLMGVLFKNNSQTSSSRRSLSSDAPVITVNDSEQPVSVPEEDSTDEYGYEYDYDEDDYDVEDLEDYYYDHDYEEEYED